MSAYNSEVLFIHIPKCGGISVKKYMREHMDGMVGHWGHEKDDAYPCPIGHIPLRDIPKYTGRELDSWKVILATVRDPYAQQLSSWRFWNDRRARGQNHELDQYSSRHYDMEGFLRDGRCDFIAWYEVTHGRAVGRPWPADPLNIDIYEWFLSVDGKLPGNVHVLPMENMAESVPKLLGIGAELPHENAGLKTTRKVQEYYNLVATSLLEFRFSWTWEQGWYVPWADQDVLRIA